MSKKTEAETIDPLFALHRIAYGEKRSAEPGTIFRPTTAEEREELLLGDDPAARELTEEEAAFAAGLDLGDTASDDDQAAAEKAAAEKAAAEKAAAEKAAAEKAGKGGEFA